MISYCKSLVKFERAETNCVSVGDVVLGCGNPIRIQSMANTDTNDTESSAQQALRIAGVGGDIVRFTAQGRTEAHNLKAIHDRLRELGFDVPLVADIHFNPEAALIAAEIVEKVRINPGNFVDKRADFTHIEYTEDEYAAELNRLGEKFKKFLDVCREHSTAVRIGVNHGSLSDRIMSRYGDTPAGMVESAMEFLEICRAENFDQVVISMKSSNVRVMIQAYRLLSSVMRDRGMCFPLHLGVTEAGDGEDGRVKSAVGIGALLADGLGDTIRVSLTENPENEIPVARELVSYFSDRANHTLIREVDESCYSPIEYKKRISTAVGIVGGDNLPVVVATVMCSFAEDETPDLIAQESRAEWVFLTLSDLTSDKIEWLSANPDKIIVLDTDNKNGVAEQRAFFLELNRYAIKTPVIIHRKYAETNVQVLQIKAAADFGILFVDGFGDGIWIENQTESIPQSQINSLSFGILQAARVRISRTEYIACPGCGRTLFDLQSTLERVRSKTKHMKGLKIGVMGCIVNGPGEMADADYGYVGAGRGKITLYKGKEVVKRNIDEADAIDELMALIASSHK